MMDKETVIYDIIIIGAGPAGLSAGIYASRGKLKTLILNEGAVGGQLVLTNEIANYPGVETVAGYSLVNNMKKQAREFGCKIKSNIQITKMDLSGDIKTIEINDKETFLSKAIILSPGGKPRSLNIPGEKEFKGNGVSYCATCDGDFFMGKHVIVVGGGNSALEEAVALTSYANKVTIVHQFDHFQAFKHAVDEIDKNEKINVILESEPREIYGDTNVRGMKIEHLPSGEIKDIIADGVFIFVGYHPNTNPFKTIINLNSSDEIMVNMNMETNIKGVYAAGDSIHKKYRQVVTAVADGAIAALAASDYLRNN